MPEAARSDDPHVCHQVDGNRPHRGGPIEYVTRGTVMTGRLPQARAGDRCRCEGPPSLIVTGSGSVFIDGRRAARKGDLTLHPPPGEVTGGFDSVRIGGGRKGAMLGGGVPSRRTCEKAKNTRVSRSAQQSRGNCGVESIRQIINLARATPITEDALLQEAFAHSEATSDPDPKHDGGSTAEQNVRTLARHGIPARAQEMDFPQIVHAVAEGRGVITTHEASILWGTNQRGSHAVLVAGMDFSDDGRMVAVLVNDTGAGECAVRLPPDVFERSLRPGADTVVTDQPIW